MGFRTSDVTVALILLLVPILSKSQEDFSNNNGEINSNKRKITSNNGGLWFGPRLGGVKRNVLDEFIELDPFLKQQHSLIELLNASPWALIPLKGNTRNTLNFTPRLGREGNSVPDNTHSPPFAPRLGREQKLHPFSPRLGRTFEEQFD